MDIKIKTDIKKCNGYKNAMYIKKCNGYKNKNVIN
jgi:hypothetical protein